MRGAFPLGAPRHLDIKPGNILIADDKLIKIADFGIAQRFRRRTGDTTSGDEDGGSGTEQARVFALRRHPPTRTPQPRNLVPLVLAAGATNNPPLCRAPRAKPPGCRRQPRSTIYSPVPVLLSSPVPGLAATGAVMDDFEDGDPVYMAPELLLEEQEFGPSADVFSAGMSLLDLASGRDLPGYDLHTKPAPRTPCPTAGLRASTPRQTVPPDCALVPRPRASANTRLFHLGPLPPHHWRVLSFLLLGLLLLARYGPNWHKLRKGCVPLQLFDGVSTDFSELILSMIRGPPARPPAPPPSSPCACLFTVVLLSFIRPAEEAEGAAGRQYSLPCGLLRPLQLAAFALRFLALVLTDRLCAVAPAGEPKSRPTTAEILAHPKVASIVRQYQLQRVLTWPIRSFTTLAQYVALVKYRPALRPAPCDPPIRLRRSRPATLLLRTPPRCLAVDISAVLGWELR